MADDDPDNNKKDKWDKAKVILEPVGGLLTALSVGLLGYYGSRLIEQRQTSDSNSRLYSELMSKREESESSLRKDMFQSIIQSFLQPGKESTSLEANVLNLELLAYNFHESLDLKPLFIHLQKEIARERDLTLRKDYSDRLEDVAREVTRKQMLVLEEGGKKFERRIDLDSMRLNPGGIPLDEDSMFVDGIARNFRVIALEADPKTKNVKVRLEVRTLSATGQEEVDPNVVEFWIGFFDFPMIDNTRLSHDQRCAIVLTNFEDDSADLTVIEFQGSHAGMKEKPYFEEILQSLKKE